MVYFIKILNIFRIIEQLHKKNFKNPRRVICVTEYKVTAERISIDAVLKTIILFQINK